MQSLFLSLYGEGLLSSERAALQLLILDANPLSDEGIRLGIQLLSLRNRSSLLTSNALLLQIAMQERLTEVNERAQGVFAFPLDSPNFKIADLPSIAAVLLEPFLPSRHCRLLDLTSVYFSQPWLAEEAVKGVRLEEELKALSLNKNKLKADLKTLKLSIGEGKVSLRTYEVRIKDLQGEIELRVKGTGFEEDDTVEAVLKRLREVCMC
jgi:hypothetical protein